MNWDELETAFRSGGEGIAADTSRRFRRRELGKLAIEFLAAGAVIAFYAVALVRAPSPPLVGIALASTLFLGVYLARLLTNRRGLLDASAVDAAAWRVILRRRVEADIRWNGFLQRSCLVMAIFGALWAPWQIATFSDAYRAEPWRAVVGLGGYYAILAGLWLLQRHARRRLEARLQALDAD